MQILLVEDEVRLAKNIALWLKHENYSVDIAYDGEEAIQKISSEYDIVILDLMLPKKNGFEVLEIVRKKWIKIPIIILSAKWEIDDKVMGLKTGADDYLVKPFSFDELIARINALLRRAHGKAETLIELDSLTLDTSSKRVTRCGKDIILSSTEFRLLEYMLLHSGEVLSETKLLEHVWDRNYMGLSNVVSVYIRYLRNKIDKDFSEEKPLIHTRRGLWYTLSNSSLW